MAAEQRSGRWPRFHQSMARTLIKECPAALKWQIENGFKQSRDMEKGTLVHQMVLGGLQFHVITATLASGPNKGKRATNFQCTAAREEAERVRANGFVPVFEHELLELQELAHGIRVAIAAYGIDLDACEREKMHQWTSPEGIECEGTPDARLVTPTGIITLDLKVSYTANPDDWDRKLDADCSDLQAAAYEEQAQAEHGDLPKQHIIVAAETEAWCPVSILPVSESYMEIGRKKWARAKHIWRNCCEDDKWPGYQSRPVSPPNYVIQREEFLQ